MADRRFPLWGITATGPATFAGASALLAAIALVAAGIPARRRWRWIQRAR